MSNWTLLHDGDSKLTWGSRASYDVSTAKCPRRIGHGGPFLTLRLSVLASTTALSTNSRHAVMGMLAARV